MNAQLSLKGMPKIAGIAFAVAGVLYLINLAFLASLGQPPAGGEAFLAFLHDHMMVGQFTILAFLLVDALLIIGFTGLYFAFANRNAAVTIATVLSVAALTADVINSLVFYADINLSSLLAAATSDQQRLAYSAVSDFAYNLALGIGESFFFILFSLVIITICALGGGLLARPVRYLGIVSGILGIVAGLTGFFPLIALWPVWFLTVAYRLLRSPSA